MQTTLVIGHKNPDTDSICSAICYAELKRRVTGESYLACRAGEKQNTYRCQPKIFFGARDPDKYVGNHRHQHNGQHRGYGRSSLHKA